MVLLRHTISTTYYGIASISCKKNTIYYNDGIGEHTKKCVVR